MVWYHACMHHGPANKLHRVATPLPLSLSCQVEPLKHSRSSPLHFHLSIQPSPHLTIQRSSSCHTSLHPPHPTPVCYTCAPIRAAEVISLPFCHSSSFIHPSIHPSPITSSSTLLSSPPLHTGTQIVSVEEASLYSKELLQTYLYVLSKIYTVCCGMCSFFLKNVIQLTVSCLLPAGSMIC